MLAHQDHQVLFYDHDTFLGTTVADYLVDGLQNDEAILVAATQGHWEMIQQELFLRGIELPSILKRGQLVYVDAELIANELLHHDAINQKKFYALVPPRLETLRQYAPAIRIYGEVVDVLMAKNHAKAALELEALWHAERDRRNFTLLCGYGMHHFADPHAAMDFDEICRCHGNVLPTERILKLAEPVQDMSAEVRIEQRSRALVRASKLIDAQTKMASLGEISAGVAHELSNPLAVLNMAVEQLLLNGTKDATQERLFSLLQRSTTKLSTIVQNIQLFSRQSSLQMETVNLAHVMQKAVDYITPDLREHRIQLHTKLLPDVFILGNAFALEQVVLNLLNNARDAIIEAKPLVDWTISLCMYSPSKEEIVIEVADNGCGMDEDLAKKIFTPFFTTKSGGRGTGLGLFMAHGIIRQHHGNLTCRSCLGHGSSFQLTLPYSAKPVG